MRTMSAEEFLVRESLLVNRMWGKGQRGATYQNPSGPSLSTSSAVAPLWSTQIKVSHAYFVRLSDAKKEPPNGGNQLQDNQEHIALRPSGSSHCYYYYWLLWQHPVTSCMLAWSVVSHSLQPQGYSLPRFSVHVTSQARILEWIAIFSSRGSSQPRDRTGIPGISWLILYPWATWGPVASSSTNQRTDQELIMYPTPTPPYLAFEDAFLKPLEESRGGFWA